ncbi:MULTISPECIES: hypothetical protein [unclassified Caballeronia]|uniref:hypothetical protein n=1 Tax=unclassified Caballeronia TaxID=2646786 RepID=UPI00285F2065|nr:MULTISPECIES: hypothetical protein [unclassified Caballeronia]MDR5816360.1 hypothetical protein [Caballeronia sp. LZ033]MDR5881158.1 hypothetical protein [Caballeronia sp. LZ032]
MASILAWRDYLPKEVMVVVKVSQACFFGDTKPPLPDLPHSLILFCITNIKDIGDDSKAVLQAPARHPIAFILWNDMQFFRVVHFGYKKLLLTSYSS